MHEENFITVLLPVYNSQFYVGTAIKSILNQTYESFELLIIDDGSTDDSASVINSFDDDRITCFHKEHTGLADSLNFGLQKAKYNLIARMDSDDISHEQRLMKQIGFLKNNPEVDWISNWYVTFKDRNPISLFKLPVTSKEIKRELILSSSLCFPSSMFKRDIVLNNNGFKDTIFEDYELMLRLKNKVEFYNLPEVLYFQRKRDESLSRLDFENKKQIIYNIQKPYYKDLKSEFGLFSEREEYYYKGWREYLYGDVNTALTHWIKLNYNLFLYPKIILAILILILPFKKNDLFRKIKFNLAPFKATRLFIKERAKAKQVLHHYRKNE